MATINMLEETANYLLNHCFVLGSVEDQRAKYLYVQDHLPEVRAVFKPLGYAVLLYPAPLQAAALVGKMFADFNAGYRKELPKNMPDPDDKTALTLWEEYMAQLLSVFAARAEKSQNYTH